MTISTQDCKDFISSITTIIQADDSDTWKRVKKYKKEELTLRDFENQDGRRLTISEKQGKLFLYDLPSPKLSLNIDALGVKFIGHDVSEQEVFNFISSCVAADDNILNAFSHEDDDKKARKDGKNPKSWAVWEKFNNQNNPNSLKDFLDDIDEYWVQLNLFYPNSNGETKINKEKILQVFWVWMPKYDTAYRIYIFETTDHHLILGVNDGD